jgi:predicted RNase H-like HicB family nuclease
MDLTVRASWDAQASVWVAESDDVPGLITEAGDLEALMRQAPGPDP